MPSSGKWEKLLPAIFFAVKMQMFGLVKLLLGPAFDGAAFHSRRKTKDSEEDPALKMDLSWHHVAGVRYDRFKAFMLDPWTRFLLLSILIVVENFRILTQFFIWASNAERSFVGFPPLMQIQYEPTSHLCWTLQYLSTLLHGSCSRVRLLWGIAHDTLVSWMKAEPREARFFRRLVLHAIGLGKFYWIWICRRTPCQKTYRFRKAHTLWVRQEFDLTR